MMRTTSDRWRRPVAAVALMLAAGGAVAIAALDDGPLSGPERYDSGQFVFARVRYADAYIVPGYYNGQNQPGWAHDYPGAESNLMRILESVTFLNPYIGGDGGVIVDLDDPDLFKYPFAYMSEPGYWNVTEREAEGLRNYLLKAGFLIFDDQRSDEHWNNLEAQMRRVLPGLRWVQLDASHPVYHSFFDIETLEQYEQAYPGYDPIFYGLFEDNDTSDRLLAVANHNNDIGDAWEWSMSGWVPIDLSNEAFKLGVNYIMYALTH